jgi:murein DD-endopeptidase MepM/ murein hydrolase activator NlpD
MKKSHWTFLYVPAGEGGVRTVRLSKRLVGALAAALLLLFVMVGVMTVGFVRQGFALHEEGRRGREIKALQAKITQLQEKSAGYEAQMSRNFELLERANLLAGLGTLDKTVIQMGVGGPEPAADPSVESLTPLSRERLSEVSEQLDKLLRQARFQEESYQQVLRVLQDDQIARETTPSIRPLQRGYLSSRYGRRIDPFTGRPAFHNGVDFSAPIGTPVHATADGVVVRASRRGRMGKMVELDHGNGVHTRYGHLNGFTVHRGQRVHRGDLIGYVGNTGRSTGPHVHYEVVQNGKTENPFLFIIRD